jgi:hypothetical protein
MRIFHRLFFFIFFVLAEFIIDAAYHAEFSANDFLYFSESEKYWRSFGVAIDTEVGIRKTCE